jgi:hypothetical protein
MKQPLFYNANEAETYVGGFSKPSKMPCPAYSIPAQECKIGKIMRGTVGSVCSKCYALKGRYVFGNVKAALYRRFNTLQKEFWVEAFAMAVNQRGYKFFRFHDAGDLQGVWHLKNIVAVALACPSCKFWLPTREATTVNEFFEQGGVCPENLTIRISGTMIDGKPPLGLAQKWNLVVSSVSSDMNEVNCHSFSNDGKCGDCRACWNKEVFNVAYLKH